MHPILKIALKLAVFFLALLLITRLFGWFTLDQIEIWFTDAQNQPIAWLVSIVIGLMLLDLLFSIPTIWVSIFAGFFLGFGTGFTTVLCGLTLAAICAYELGTRWGEHLLDKLITSPEERRRLHDDFLEYGPLMILLSRSAPMLPEISYCIAGLSKMPRARFMLFFLIGHIPYALITTYAGSQSALDTPYPAIVGLLTIYAILWSGAWYLRHRVR